MSIELVLNVAGDVENIAILAQNFLKPHAQNAALLGLIKRAVPNIKYPIGKSSVDYISLTGEDFPCAPLS